jgi:hypothetical protein
VCLQINLSHSTSQTLPFENLNQVRILVDSGSLGGAVQQREERGRVAGGPGGGCKGLLEEQGRREVREQGGKGTGWEGGERGRVAGGYVGCVRARPVVVDTWQQGG